MNTAIGYAEEKLFKFFFGQNNINQSQGENLQNSSNFLGHKKSAEELEQSLAKLSEADWNSTKAINTNNQKAIQDYYQKNEIKQLKGNSFEEIKSNVSKALQGYMSKINNAKEELFQKIFAKNSSLSDKEKLTLLKQGLNYQIKNYYENYNNDEDKDPWIENKTPQARATYRAYRNYPNENTLKELSKNLTNIYLEFLPKKHHNPLQENSFSNKIRKLIDEQIAQYIQEGNFFWNHHNNNLSTFMGDLPDFIKVDQESNPEPKAQILKDAKAYIKFKYEELSKGSWFKKTFDYDKQDENLRSNFEKALNKLVDARIEKMVHVVKALANSY